GDAATITDVTFGFNTATQRDEAVLTLSAPLAKGDYVLAASSAIKDSNGNAIDGDRDGTPGGDFVLRFGVKPVLAAGAEFRVNTPVTGRQESAKTASDASGNFVVVWAGDGQGGDGSDIYAQLYSAAGVALGTAFRVNTATADSQEQPAVAMDADGDFVVT